jgi:gas vesicle protein
MSQTEKACIAGALLGAAAGAVIAYLYATEEGGRRRASLAQLVERGLGDVDEARHLWMKVHEAWSRFDESRQMPGRSSSPRSWTPEGVG